MSDDDTKDTIKKIKESNEMTFGEFQELEKKSKEGKLERDEEIKFQQGMKEFSKMLPKLSPAVRNIFGMARTNSPLNVLSNLEKTPTIKKLIDASRLSKVLMDDLKTIHMTSITPIIPASIVPKSKKIERDISEVKKGINKINVNQEEDSKKIKTIQVQTKPPSKLKRFFTLVFVFFSGVGASLIATYVFQYIQGLEN